MVRHGLHDLTDQVGRTVKSEATPRAGARVNHMLSECGKKNPYLSCLCGLSGARKCCCNLGAYAGLSGLWLSMPIAGPLRNVGYYFLILSTHGSFPLISALYILQE